MTRLKKRALAYRFCVTTNAWLAVACGNAALDDGGGTSVAKTQQNIIAGFSANNSALNAIGSLSVLYDYAPDYRSFQPVCTGTMITDNSVLTAKHCWDELEYVWSYGAKAVFTLGPDAYNPAHYAEVVDAELAPNDSGGFTHRGHDLAVLHLGEHIKDVTPIGFSGLSDEQLGQDFVAIGYGVHGNSGSSGSRRLGTVTLRTRSGRAYEALFGSFAAYYEWQTGSPVPSYCEDDQDGGVPAGGRGGSGGKGGSGGRGGTGGKGGCGGGGKGGCGGWGGWGGWDGSYPDDCYNYEYLRSEYENTLLEPTDELVAGGAPGNAQPCTTDSGGPLVRRDAAGVLLSYGVVSGGVGSGELQCDHGAVYASFDEQLLQFLTKAAHWVDPCEGLTTTGECVGTVAQRCTNRLEGKRRRIHFDCAAVGLSCEIQNDASIGCGADDQFWTDAPALPILSLEKAQSIRDTGFVSPGAEPTP